jgi:hypothetical protein
MSGRAHLAEELLCKLRLFANEIGLSWQQRGSTWLTLFLSLTFVYIDGWVSSLIFQELHGLALKERATLPRAIVIVQRRYVTRL